MKLNPGSVDGGHGSLHIITTKDQNRLRCPAVSSPSSMGVDMWEHACYLQASSGFCLEEEPLDGPSSRGHPCLHNLLS